MTPTRQLEEATFEPSPKNRKCTSTPSMLVLGDINIFSEILFYSGCWKNCRAASKYFYATVNGLLKQLVIDESAGKEVIMRIVSQVPNISALILDRVAAVDNSLLIYILQSCPKLKYLSLAYCNEFDYSVFEMKPKHLRVNIHGCWRLLSPHPSMSPLTVVENQLLAFRASLNGYADGIFRGAAYLSPSRKSVLGSLFMPTIKPKYLPLAACKSFCVRQLNLSARFPTCEAAFLVSVCTVPSKVEHFLWTLSQEKTMPSLKGCWMTDFIYPIQHPLLSTLSFSNNSVSCL